MSELKKGGLYRRFVRWHRGDMCMFLFCLYLLVTRTHNIVSRAHDLVCSVHEINKKHTHVTSVSP